MRIVNGNILNADEKIIVHQINAVTTYARGLAQYIFEKYPYSNVYRERRISEDCDGKKIAMIEDISDPGTIIIRTNSLNSAKPIIIGLVGQHMPGRVGMTYFYKSIYGDMETNKMREEWFKSGLEHLKAYVEKNNVNAIAMLYNIGCGLAGGTWAVYSSMLLNFETETKCEVVLYKINDD